MIYNFADHTSVISQYLTEMRDIKTQNDKMRFRNNLMRVAQIMAYEISKELMYEVVQIDTPLGIAPCKKISDKIVVASILRAGLPMHNGFLEM